MFEGKILILQEDEVDKVTQRPMWLASYVVVVKKDGSTEVIKDRFDVGLNPLKIEIGSPFYGAT